MIFSVFKSLGCPNGCGDGIRGSYGDHLRAKGHNCLQRLQRINPVLFRTYLRETVKKMVVQETVDFLHAFLGFCVDPTSILHPNQGQGQGKITHTTTINVDLCKFHDLSLSCFGFSFFNQ